MLRRKLKDRAEIKARRSLSQNLDFWPAQMESYQASELRFLSVKG
jgi:hypothetical protein